jgi:hypothetical protein
MLKLEIILYFHYKNGHKNNRNNFKQREYNIKHDKEKYKIIQFYFNLLKNIQKQ